jgi:hypothetical protein
MRTYIIMKDVSNGFHDFFVMDFARTSCNAHCGLQQSPGGAWSVPINTETDSGPRGVRKMP